jgi:nickel-dependent lactate racemase
MNKSKEYYKEHPVEFIEDLYDVKLLQYQKEILLKIHNNPDGEWYLYGGRMQGRRFILNAVEDYRKIIRSEAGQ